MGVYHKFEEKNLEHIKEADIPSILLTYKKQGKAISPQQLLEKASQKWKDMSDDGAVGYMRLAQLANKVKLPKATLKSFLWLDSINPILDYFTERLKENIYYRFPTFDSGQNVREKLGIPETPKKRRNKINSFAILKQIKNLKK